MGGGNAQKTAMARAKKLADASKSGAGSQLKANASAMSLTCQICRQQFVCTTTEAKAREHADAKHPKNEFYACFPTFKPEG